MNILSIAVLAFVIYGLIVLINKLEQGVRVLLLILVGMIVWTLFGKYLLPVIIFLVGLYLFGLVVAFIYGAASSLYEQLNKDV